MCGGAPEDKGASGLNHNVRMTARLFAFAVWAALAASVAFWGLRLLVKSPATPGHAVAVADGAAASGDVSRLLGASPRPVDTEAQSVAPEIGSRFRLTGVMAPKSRSTSAQGVALISVDGKPPRAFGVGARVDGELLLQAVSLRTASIGVAQAAPSVVLELPLLPPPATGSLPPAGVGLGAPLVMPGVSPSTMARPQQPAPLIAPPIAQQIAPPSAPPKQQGPDTLQSQ